MENIEYKLIAKTDIWTGDVDRKGEHLKNTGLLGSIRWWFEVLVRGLGGYACDPTKTDCTAKEHCVVCELFGCTGWARKFRFEVLDDNGDIKKDKIIQDQSFFLHFVPLRLVCPEELAFLNMTFRLISEYGAIGGKTVLKPSDEPERAGAPQHKDYGLVQLNLDSEPKGAADSADLQPYLSKWPYRNSNTNFGWASLLNFWCVRGKYLARQKVDTSSFNRVIGRTEDKQQRSQNDSWIAGYKPDKKKSIDPASKKVFSFKKPARTYGFIENVNDKNWIGIRKKLEALKVETEDWKDFEYTRDFLTGKDIMVKLFESKGEI